MDLSCIILATDTKSVWAEGMRVGVILGPVLRPHEFWIASSLRGAGDHATQLAPQHTLIKRTKTLGGKRLLSSYPMLTLSEAFLSSHSKS